jgi:hypothetical protein
MHGLFLPCAYGVSTQTRPLLRCSLTQQPHALQSLPLVDAQQT